MRTKCRRSVLAVLLGIILTACASKPEIFPDRTPLLVFALEAESYAEAVKAAQRQQRSLRTGIGATIRFSHLPFGVECFVPDKPQRGVNKSSDTELTANQAEEYRRANSRYAFLPKFRSNGVLDYWGNRTFRNGKPNVPGFIFAVSEVFHEAPDVYQLSSIHVSGYVPGALSSAGGRYSDFEAPEVRPALFADKASIVFVGPMRLLPSEDNTMTFEWMKLEPGPFLAAVADASGRPADTVVSADKYVINGDRCIESDAPS